MTPPPADTDSSVSSERALSTMSQSQPMEQRVSEAGPWRILHLTAGSDAGGLSRYLFDLAQAMEARGHEAVFAGEHGAWHSMFAATHWPWHDMPLKGGFLALRKCAKQLVQIVQQQRIDLIHTHYRKAAMVGRRIANVTDIPLLFTLHLTGISLSPVHRWLTDFGDHTHAPSAEARDWLIEQGRVDPQRITVIPHGIETSRYPAANAQVRLDARKKLNLPPDAVIGAYVGRFDQPKNEDWLLDLAQAAASRLPHFHLLMMGEGPHESQLAQQIQQRDLSARVTMLPAGPPLVAYQACDAFLLPSAREGFSLVCAEAMSVGRPVVRTATAGTREMIVPGETGIAVDIDKTQFIEKALDMLSDHNAMQQMGQKAAAYVRQHLTYRRQIDQTCQLYHRMISNRPKSSR